MGHLRLDEGKCVCTLPIPSSTARSSLFSAEVFQAVASAAPPPGFSARYNSRAPFTGSRKAKRVREVKFASKVEVAKAEMSWLYITAVSILVVLGSDIFAREAFFAVDEIIRDVNSDDSEGPGRRRCGGVLEALIYKD